MIMLCINVIYCISSLCLFLVVKETNNSGILDMRNARKQTPDSYPCGTEICTCKEERAVCEGYEKDLQYIPKLPSNITELLFSDNYLQVISATTFDNISDLNLQWVFLSNNQVQNLTRDSFVHLPYLKTLWLHKEPELRIAQIADAFSSLNKTEIKNIHLNEMEFTVIPEHAFVNLYDSNIESIDISMNRLQYMETKPFSGLNCLSEISVYRNNILSLELDFPLEHLTYLALYDNHLSVVPNFCNDNHQSLTPVLSSLDLGYNKITNLKIESFRCLSALQILSLSGNPLTVISDNFLSLLILLGHLEISNIVKLDSVVQVKVENYAFNSSSLERLIYKKNDLKNYFREYYNPDFIFKYCPFLTDFSLSHTTLPANKTKLVSLFANLAHIQILDLSYTGIESLPEVIFSNMTSLKHLDLSGNRLGSWNNQVLIRNSKISFLSLKGNQISVINDTYFPSLLLKCLHCLDLSENPYTCTCQTIESVKWFRKYTDQLVAYPDDYYCVTPADVNGILLKDYNPSPESCEDKNIALLVSVPVSLISVATLSVIVLVYKCRWRLRYGLYLFNNKYKSYERIKDSDSFVYTGFVIYSDDDRDWVHNELLQRFEQQEGFRLCIRLRDFDVGKVHVDNIVDNMLLSEKIIVVLSNNFAKDKWCHFQLLLAETRLLEQNTDMLVLFMLQEIHSDCLRTSLYKLVKDKQYALWSNDETGNILFWEQAISQMKRVTLIK